MTLADQFGVAQSSMKALAYGSEAMWAATILLLARIRARMASMALSGVINNRNGLLRPLLLSSYRWAGHHPAA
jgi:hypothetical protein